MQCFKQRNCTCIVMTGTDMIPVPILSGDTNTTSSLSLKGLPISRQITKVRRKLAPPHACQLATVGLHKFVLQLRPSFWVICSSAIASSWNRQKPLYWAQIKSHCPPPSRTLFQRMTNTDFFQVCCWRKLSWTLQGTSITGIYVCEEGTAVHVFFVIFGS